MRLTLLLLAGASSVSTTDISTCFYSFVNGNNDQPVVFQDTSQYFTTGAGSRLLCLSKEVETAPNGHTAAVGSYTQGITETILANGQPCSLNTSKINGMSYGFCVDRCGSGAEAFQWAYFSQSFTSWLLPWLALVSNLPYGARRLEDNIIAMILAVGSPVLAAYSLVLTLLNGRWVAERFSNIRYRQYRRACRIIAALQQAPLCLSTENHHLALLVVLPINDGWWKDCLDRLSVSHTWSIAAATSISWVLIAYLFTVAQSFQSLAPLPFSNNVSDGQAIGTVWLWLLPTVVGWLQISPKCDSHYLEHIFEKANEHAYEDQGINGLPPTKNRSPAFSMYKSNLNSMDTQGGHAICTAPIFNYARIFTWTQQTETVRSMFLAAANKRNAEAAAHNSPCRENFTSDQALDYCSSKELRSHWGPGIWKRIILASVAALYLQWGTASASIIIQYFTPTVGLGCRSASVLLYAASSTLVWLFLTTSSILSHSASPHHPSLTLDCSTSRTQSDSATASKRFLRLLASIMRTLGVMIAVLNAIQFVISSGLQFGGIYSNCWCESVKLTLGLEAYVTVLIRDNDLRSPWIGGVVLGISTVVIFTLGTSLFYNPEIDPRERDNEM